MEPHIFTLAWHRLLFYFLSLLILFLLLIFSWGINEYDAVSLEKGLRFLKI